MPRLSTWLFTLPRLPSSTRSSSPHGHRFSPDPLLPSRDVFCHDPKHATPTGLVLTTLKRLSACPTICISHLRYFPASMHPCICLLSPPPSRSSCKGKRRLRDDRQVPLHLPQPSPSRSQSMSSMSTPTPRRQTRTPIALSCRMGALPLRSPPRASISPMVTSSSHSLVPCIPRLPLRTIRRCNTKGNTSKTNTSTPSKFKRSPRLAVAVHYRCRKTQLPWTVMITSICAPLYQKYSCSMVISSSIYKRLVTVILRYQRRHFSVSSISFVRSDQNSSVICCHNRTTLVRSLVSRYQVRSSTLSSWITIHLIRGCLIWSAVCREDKRLQAEIGNTSQYNQAHSQLLFA
jgi:hypothetical protein